MKKFILPVLVVAVLVSGIVAVQANAQDSTENPQITLVKKIAQKFNLNEDEVQEVFDQDMAERETQMKTRMGNRLDQAVKDGKITDAQKQLILNKIEELKKNRQADMEQFKNMSDEERQAAMKAKHDELQKWAKDNGIDENLLMFKMKFHGSGGRNLFMMKAN